MLAMYSWDINQIQGSTRHIVRNVYYAVWVFSEGVIAEYNESYTQQGLFIIRSFAKPPLRESSTVPLLKYLRVYSYVNHDILTEFHLNMQKSLESYLLMYLKAFIMYLSFYPYFFPSMKPYFFLKTLEIHLQYFEIYCIMEQYFYRGEKHESYYCHGNLPGLLTLSKGKV